MKTKEIIGPTPNGGVKSQIFFQDENGNPAEEEVATHAEIVEYDADDKVIQRTYGTFGQRPSPTED